MKLQRHTQNSGLTLLSGLVIFACIILIGVLLMNILLKTMEKLPPPTHPGTFTNTLTSVTSEQYAALQAAQTVTMPAFTFDEADLLTLDAESFAVGGQILIERSTNLVDWQPAWRIGAMSEFNFGVDTNGLALPQCFYRAVLIP